MTDLSFWRRSTLIVDELKAKQRDFDDDQLIEFGILCSLQSIASSLNTIKMQNIQK